MIGRAIAIGASAGGIESISSLLATLPADFGAPIFIVQHVGRTSSGMLPAILQRRSRLPVVHARQGLGIAPGHVYVAPPDHHMMVSDHSLYLSRGPEENHCRPAIDVLFRSVALAYGAGSVGILLSGYLSDGTAGLVAIADLGGVTIVQDPSEAPAASMVLSALARVRIDHVCRVAAIGSLLVELVADAPGETATAPILDLENRIAAAHTAPAELATLVASAPVRGVCPTCGRPLHLMPERRLTRLRCAVGHAFTAVTDEIARPRPAPPAREPARASETAPAGGAAAHPTQPARRA